MARNITDERALELKTASEAVGVKTVDAIQEFILAGDVTQELRLRVAYITLDILKAAAIGALVSKMPRQDWQDACEVAWDISQGKPDPVSADLKAKVAEVTKH